ncbi:MAG TPA: ROK family protein [Candidatus Eremiobacteraceae bacterium]|nr:ROK family protein [Candidatus Eremiobacteraceae bacterium]
MAWAIGVDLGGTHVMAATVDDRGKIRSRFQHELKSHDFDDVVDRIGTAVGKAAASLKGRKVEGVGVGSPGNIDERTGTVRWSPNFEWKNVPLGAALKRRLGQRVHILNDARSATLGEYVHGCGKGTQDFALITIGTGIGGGIVASGKLILGHGMGAGEVGHHQIRPDTGFICMCGKVGCFEAQASGTGLLRHALAVAPSFPRSMLFLQRKPADWGSKMIVKAAAAGDPHGAAAWERYLDDLAIGVANIVAFTNPQMVALGGGVGQTDRAMLAVPLKRRVDVLTTMAPKDTKIVSAALGNDAGAVGGAVLAFLGGIKALRAARSF